jgi:hypothetical protein
MKATVWVDLSREIEVNIDGASAAAAIMEGSDDGPPIDLLKRIANNFLVTLRNLPDSVIAELSPQARKVIGDEMEKQTARFR